MVWYTSELCTGSGERVRGTAPWRCEREGMSAGSDAGRSLRWAAVGTFAAQGYQAHPALGALTGLSRSTFNSCRQRLTGFRGAAGVERGARARASYCGADQPGHRQRTRLCRSSARRPRAEAGWASLRSRPGAAPGTSYRPAQRGRAALAGCLLPVAWRVPVGTCLILGGG